MTPSAHPRMTGRRLILVAAAVLVVAGVLAYPRLQISYHRWQLERGRDYMLGLDRCWGTGEFLWTDSFEGYSGDATHFDHHLHRLVQLGEIRFHQYQFQHVRSRTEQARHFHQILYDVPSIHWSSPFWEEGTPITVDVWTEWADAQAWDAFIAERDVPDYREKFMQDGG